MPRTGSYIPGGVIALWRTQNALIGYLGPLWIWKRLSARAVPGIGSCLRVRRKPIVRFALRSPEGLFS